MKTKKINRKLSLNKATVVDLNKNAMNEVKGGFSIDLSCYPTACGYCSDDCTPFTETCSEQLQCRTV